VTHVTDVNGNVILKTKFPYYYVIMYTASKTPRYSDLWKKRKVFLQN